METAIAFEEVLVCQTCGAEGFTNAFIYCVKCLGFVIHRYCLDVIAKTPDEFVFWFCDDCKPPVPYHYTLSPKHDPSQSHTNSALVKMTHPKKKLKKKRQKKKKPQKKRKIVSLVAGKEDDCVSVPNPVSRCVVLGLEKPKYECLQPQKGDATSLKTRKRKLKPKKKQRTKRKVVPAKPKVEECVSPLNEALVKSDSGANQMTPCVVEKQSTLKGKSNETCCVGVKTKRHKTGKTMEHSSCESSCTDVTLKESKTVDVGHEKSLSITTAQIETQNLMHDKQDMRGGSGASQSTYFEKNNNNNNIHYQPARPVLEPVWRGSFSITETDYDVFEGFVGHLSSKACYKVCEEATTLPSMLSLQMHSKTHLWPKSFLDSLPSDENIALYFFPGHTKNERDFEQLVNVMIEQELAMKTTAINAELLIFTSKVLPQAYWRFQGNYYLWGVFRGKKNDDHDVAVSNHSDNHGLSRNQVTSEKEILTNVKTIESRSPQSPLCNYR